VPNDRSWTNQRVILKKYRASVLLGNIVNVADTDNTLYQQGPGLQHPWDFATSATRMTMS
jgi:hypothetical protein